MTKLSKLCTKKKLITQKRLSLVGWGEGDSFVTKKMH